MPQNTKHPVVLSVTRIEHLNRKPKSVQTPEEIDEIKQQVADRDDHTCYFCGFRSEKHQHLHHLNHDIYNFDEKNLVTACSFCAQCFHLDQVAERKSGLLIWLPEISQTQLNHLARVLYIARITQGPLSSAARDCLDQLMARREDALSRLGTDDPGVLATILGDFLEEKAFLQSRKRLAGIRLLPLDRSLMKDGDLEFNQFPQMLAYWRSKNGPFANYKPDEWFKLAQEQAQISAQ